MSLVTEKTPLCASKGTSVIMLEIPQINKKNNLKAGGVMATVTNEKYTLKGVDLKHLLYRRANLKHVQLYKS